MRYRGKKGNAVAGVSCERDAASAARLPLTAGWNRSFARNG